MTHDQDILRRSLERLADQAPHSTPALAPQTLMAAHRRSVRRKRAGAVATCAALGAIAFGAVSVGALPMDGAPTSQHAGGGAAVTVPKGPVKTPLDIGRVRGSLAPDILFQRGLVAHVSRDLPHSPSGGPLRPSNHAEIKILYASDVAGRRVALVQLPAASGEAEDIYRVWYHGEAGAQAGELVAGTGDYAIGETSIFSHALLQKPGQPANQVAILVTSSEKPAEVAGVPTYAADGSVEWPVRTVAPDRDGVIALTPAAEESYRFWDPRAARYHLWSRPLGTGVSPEEMAKVNPPVRDGGRLRTARFLQVPHGAAFVAQSQAWTGLPLNQSSRRLLWVGPIGDRAAGAALVVTAPSGAQIVLVQVEDGDAGVQVNEIVPAGRPLERITVAWAETEKGKTGKNPDQPDITVVNAIGPADASEARMTDTRGRALVTALSVGAGQLRLIEPNTAGETVEFLDRAGKVMATAKVRPRAFDALNESRN